MMMATISNDPLPGGNVIMLAPTLADASHAHGRMSIDYVENYAA